MTMQGEILTKRVNPGVSRSVKACLGVGALLLGYCNGIAAVDYSFGTSQRPFSKNSPWNIRPIAPKFGAATIPKSQYFPAIVDGKYSVGVFTADALDKPEIIYMPEGSKGILVADEEEFKPFITIPRWPNRTFPAEGTDGHADIVDPIAGVIHSFHKLTRQNGKWRAGFYAWAALDGRGWGDPAHYYQGARAVGIPAMAGLIRTHEVNNGERIYKHALAMSLTFNGLSAKPAYVFPATAADTGADSNSGDIPQGALLMLPPDYDTKRIRDEGVRKIAETLKVYGAYVVDRNHGTPFAIYAEIGSGIKSPEKIWNAAVAVELDRMREALRVVESAESWVDNAGKAVAVDRNLNLLSMRGPWSAVSGSERGRFDMFTQRLVFDRPEQVVVQINNSSRSMQPVTWAIPIAGDELIFSVHALNHAKLGIKLRGKAGNLLWESGLLADGESAQFQWPIKNASVELYAQSGPSRTISWVTGNVLRRMPNRVEKGKNK